MLRSLVACISRLSLNYGIPKSSIALNTGLRYRSLSQRFNFSSNMALLVLPPILWILLGAFVFIAWLFERDPLPHIPTAGTGIWRLRSFGGLRFFFDAQSIIFEGYRTVGA